MNKVLASITILCFGLMVLIFISSIAAFIVTGYYPDSDLSLVINRFFNLLQN